MVTLPISPYALTGPWTHNLRAKLLPMPSTGGLASSFSVFYNHPDAPFPFFKSNKKKKKTNQIIQWTVTDLLRYKITRREEKTGCDIKELVQKAGSLFLRTCNVMSRHSP